MLIWIVGCAIVDYQLDNIANAWKMFAGALTAGFGLCIIEVFFNDN